MPSKAALRASAAMKKDGPQPLSDDVRKSLISTASAIAQEEISKCNLFDKKEMELISRFEEKEVNLGKKLGTGGFCSVFEVTGFDLFSELASKSEQAHLSNMKEFHTRDYMSNNHTRRNSFDKDEARYAVKRLSENTLANEDLFQKGVADLAIEAHFLAVIQHRNIVKVRGYALGDFCNDSFFIMMDRLYDTLDSAIRKWKERSKKNSSIFTRGGKQKTADLFSERIEYAWEIANAAEFLHFKNIIYRDLKPENIGFDVRGDIKLFDFGLAREVRDPDANGNYNLTGYAGSPIYMAPEVMKSAPYNLSADVYSFGILLWELLSLSEPYRKLPIKVMERMIMEKHYRPECDDKWPAQVTHIIKESWHPTSQKRPTFTSIKEMLSKIITEAGGDEGNLDLSMDKSTRSFYQKKGLM